MTHETYDNLSSALGRKLTNKEWIDLISENFGVSRSVAKEMLHNMLNTPKYKYREVKNEHCVPEKIPSYNPFSYS